MYFICNVPEIFMRKDKNIQNFRLLIFRNVIRTIYIHQHYEISMSIK